MRVKMKHRVNDYAPGNVYELSDSYAKTLITGGWAEQTDEPVTIEADTPSIVVGLDLSKISDQSVVTKTDVKKSAKK